MDRSAVITVKVQNKECSALVDTGATRCCISKKYYDTLDLQEPKELYGLTVTTASGESIAPVGIVECAFIVGKKEFSHNFIVCEKMRRPMILGLDFLRKHRIGTGWSAQGKFMLQTQNQLLVESIETFFKEESPKLITKSGIEIPERSLVVIQTKVEIPPEHCERMFDTVPTKEMVEEYPELITIPLIHKTSQRNYNIVCICINKYWK